MKKSEVLKFQAIIKKYQVLGGRCDVICHKPERVARGQYEVTLESKMWLSSVLFEQLSDFMVTTSYRVRVWTDGEKIFMSIV